MKASSLLVAMFLVAVSCGPTIAPVASPMTSASRVITPSPGARSSATTLASPFPSPACVHLNAARRYAIVWLSTDAAGGGVRPDSYVQIRDVTDPTNQINQYSMGLGGDTPTRFGTSPDQIVFIGQQQAYVMRMCPITGITCTAGSACFSSKQPLVTFPPTQIVASLDLTPDGSHWAYALVNRCTATSPCSPGLSPGSFSYPVSIHLADALSDVEVARFTALSEPGVDTGARVEFSPDGQYLAAGVSGASGVGSDYAVKIWTLSGSVVFAAKGSRQLAWVGRGDHLYFDDGTQATQWPNGGTAMSIGGRMLTPAVSPGGQYIAFNDGVMQPNRLLMLDTLTSRVVAVPGFGSKAAFLTNSLLHFEPQVICNPSCPPYGSVMPGHMSIYNLADGTITQSSILAIFDTWPRGNKPWGVA